MDIDFHYGTVYVLARWAKFGSENANLIAHASQLVDDNFDSTPFSDEEEKKNIAELIIAKQRNGSLGTVKLGWKGEYTWFVDLNPNAKEAEPQ